MKFQINRYRIPVQIIDGKAEYSEVEYKDKFVDNEDIEVTGVNDITVHAKNISNYNLAQLKLAEMDEDVKVVFKKMLVKI